MVVAVDITEDGQAQVDGNVDQAAGGGGALLAVGLAEDSQAGVDGHVDQRAAVAAGGGGLVTLGLAEGSNAAVDRHVDQTVADGLLLALDVTEDGTAETDGDAEEAARGVDALFTSLAGCLPAGWVSAMFRLQRQRQEP